MSQERKIMPAVPVRDVVVFPSTIIPLFIGRDSSIESIKQAITGEGFLFLVTQIKATTDIPQQNEVYSVGTICKIPQVLKLPDGSYKVLIEGVARGQLMTWDQGDFIKATVMELHDDHQPARDDQPALIKVLLTKYAQYIKITGTVSNIESLGPLSKVTNLSTLCDLIASQLPLSIELKQGILSTPSSSERLEKTMLALQQEIEWLKIDQKINAKIKERITDDQEKYYRNQKLRVIQQELEEGLSEDDPAVTEQGELAKKIKALKLPKESNEKVMAELDKLKMMPPMSAEATVVRMYLDWVVALPWHKRSKSDHDINRVAKKLDVHHFGLEKVKDRILQLLAVQKRVKVVSGPILCLVGPPGVGKTSLGQSVADAMGRPFVRISLGGVRDEAEIRGHRKTYIGSMPGRIIKAIKRAGVKNPLILLDEIDKMGMDYRGDPASALLEVLDSEQNQKFSDHYLEIDFDLSEVLFITTANSLNIPTALRDRMEIIQLSGYTEKEKITIATRYLLPTALKQNGLKKEELFCTPNAMINIVRAYTKESGVRGLNRMLNLLCRKVLLEQLKHQESSKSKPGLKAKKVSQQNLVKYLGVARYDRTVLKRCDQIGVVNGLAWTELGGEVLKIESVMYPGKGGVHYTGSLGDVMKESIKTAISVVRKFSGKYKVNEALFKSHDLHVHVPEGATPKDGPSAGIGMCTAILSVLTDTPIHATVAMTGELTLVGDVLAIGGLKEKLLAALRYKITDVIVPEANRRDMHEMPIEITKGLKVHFVNHIVEVFPLALQEKHT
ncbi:MAG: endopeptidase La [Pseudomonadota bacterium]|nr:endopeptidase La [Pseudomonadota bacterium]